MDDQDLEIMKAVIGEFAALGRKITSGTEEALELLKAGRYQDACNIASLQHYPLGQAGRSYRAILEEFEKRGYVPGDKAGS